jgi:hypothetical protein
MIESLPEEAKLKAALHLLAISQDAIDQITNNLEKADALEGLAVVARPIDPRISDCAGDAARDLRSAEERQQKLRLFFSERVSD